MTGRFRWMVLSSLWLAGCAVGPDYQVPDTPVPDHWQVRQAGQLANLTNWWQQFHDPVLIQLQNNAQRNSTSLAKALAAIDKARANRSSAESSLWPSLTASASQTATGSFKNAGNTAASRAAELDASWELDLFGKTRRNTESADALISARQADWHDARVTLAAEVATDYVDYRVCRIKQAYYEAQAQSQDQTQALTTLSAKAGFTSPADAALANASTASTRASALAQQAECEVLVKTLVAVTGDTEPSLRRLLAQSHPTLPQTRGIQVDAIPAEVIRQRPDVVAAERALASSSALIGVAEAARWPSFTLTGSISYSKTQGSAIGLPWSFGPSLSLPVLDGGSIDANIRSARADYATALATYQQTVRDAVKEVEQAMVRLDSMAARETALRQSADGYRAYLNATERYRQVGGSSQLDLESARRSAISADINLLDLQQSRLEYWIALYKAVGGGWDNDAQPWSIPE